LRRGENLGGEKVSFYREEGRLGRRQRRERSASGNFSKRGGFLQLGSAKFEIQEGGVCGKEKIRGENVLVAAKN